MQQIFIILISLFIFYCDVLGQQIRIDNKDISWVFVKNSMELDYAIDKRSNRLLDGTYDIYIGNGWNTHTITNFKNGKKHGLDLSFYSNGKLESETNYKNGKEHGDAIGYYKSGSIKHKAKYINGKRHGEYLQFYENGQLQLRRETYSNGEWIGTEKIYYENGKLYRMTTNHGHKSNSINERKWYYKNGELGVIIRFFPDNKSKLEIYTESGQLELEIYAEDAIPTDGWYVQNKQNKKLNRAELFEFYSEKYISNRFPIK